MSEGPAALIVGEDERPRCSWSGRDAVYMKYHDEEWGVPLRGDQALFEKISLEAFQAGLSWATILHKRPAFRAAFHDFDFRVVSAFSEGDVERLMTDAAIVRNRAKIVATVANARAARAMADASPGSLSDLVWSFAPAGGPPRPHRWAEVRATTRESEALSKELRRFGFSFVGPTTMHALMQSAGLVEEHFVGCWRADLQVRTR